MKHDCYTCVKSPDKTVPFRCPYVSLLSYDALQRESADGTCKYVYPNDKDCFIWSMSLPKTVKYISGIIIDIVAPLMISIMCLAGVVAIVCLIIVSKMAIGV